ncbi:UNVERIFIED_CONTAM: KH domain-containing protein HEN4 [Sesamum radiatum]|uniref:KH domain-containing protein HEN4 n=1 Tax=Sesamum radiatum TaxID=300843 RepID=A0AAW2RWD1_SESRA
MESSLLFPPVKRPVYTTSTTMHEPNTNNTTHLPTSAASRRSKPPQPPLFVPSGHIAFRLLCHASRIGGLIGRSGSIINSFSNSPTAKSGSKTRRIPAITGLSALLPRQLLFTRLKFLRLQRKKTTKRPVRAGIVRVFERVVEVAAEGDDVAAIDGVVSCRLLVWKNQGGAIIGKGGKVVEKIRKDTGCRIKVLTVEGSLPTDEIVEIGTKIRESKIEGNVLAVKKALVAVTGRLQEFPPLDRTRTFGTRPLEAESVPIPSVDLPLQGAPILQQMPSNSANHASGIVGGIIGKGGSIVKALQTETGASISIGPTIAECDERLITITAMESVESQYSPAQNAAVLVFHRSVEAGLVNGMDSDSKGSPVSARVVVPSNQVGCLLGKGGAIISEMRKVTGAALRIFAGNQVPKCASENDEVLQITGELLNVQDALYKVTDRLRSNMFSIRMSTGSGNRNFSRTENIAFGRVRDPPPFGSQFSVGGSDNLSDLKSLRQSMDHLGISKNIDRPSSPSSLTPTTVYGVNQRNVTDIGERPPSVINGVELASGSRPVVVTNTTVEIVVPDNLIGSIYGENCSNLSRLRQISGAKVIVQEPRPGTTQRTVIISGTPDETQAAQSLLQAFMLS